jgi:hypothetical protein
MEPSDYNKSVMQDTILHRRSRTTIRMEKMGMHNRSEDGRGARVTLHIHPTNPI